MRHRCRIRKAHGSHSRAATGRHGKTSGLHFLGTSRVFILLSRASFPVLVINVINKDAASIAVSSYGPHGAFNDNEATTMLTTRLSETPVFTTWKRRDPEMPHLRPWLRRWVVGTLSPRSGRYESGSLDLHIGTLGFTDQLSIIVGR